MLAIEQQRAAAEAEREQRIRESAELAQREQELTTLSAEALAQARAIAAQAQELRQQLATMETHLKTARAALDQLREDRSGRSSEVGEAAFRPGAPGSKLPCRSERRGCQSARRC